VLRQLEGVPYEEKEMKAPLNEFKFIGLVICIFIFLVLFSTLGSLYWVSREESKKASALKEVVDARSNMFMANVITGEKEKQFTCPYQSHDYWMWKSAKDDPAVLLIGPDLEPILATCLTDLKFTLSSKGEYDPKSSFESAEVWWENVQVSHIQWETDTKADFAEGQFRICICENGILFLRRE